jgi:Zn-dependent oligopeptidase
VLAQWATHNETSKGIREELVDEALALRKTYSGFDAMTQILYAAVDQVTPIHLVTCSVLQFILKASIIV